MLVQASAVGLGALAADIAAILEEKDPVGDENDADIGTRIDLLREQRAFNGKDKRFSRIARIAAEYRRMVRCDEDNSAAPADSIGALIACAYPERIAMRLSDGVYRLPSGENVRLNEADNLSAYEFLAVASLGRRIFLASPVSRDVLLELAQPHENISWNSRDGRLMARREMRIGVLAIASRPLDNPSQDVLAQALCRAAVKEGRSMFDFNEDVTRLQQRIATVAEWHPELDLPDVTTEHLLTTASEWLPMYMGRATTVQELRKIDICEVIKGIVGYELMERTDAIAPTHLRLPGGRNARIDYRPGNPVPVVSARLQDCLGLFDTPRLDGGTRPVLMELLSPGFKPVQLTQDLRGFWSNTYFEVRKELKRRYPKHRWPDDPFNL